MHKHGSRLLFYRPDSDRYFNVPGIDGPDYRMDGVDVTANFGSVSANIFAAQPSRVRSVDDDSPLFSPWIGVDRSQGHRVFTSNQKPLGNGPDNGQIMVEQVAGVSLGLKHNLLEGGNVAFHGLAAVGDADGRAAALAVGADVDLKINDRTNFNGSWGKTMAGYGDNIGGGTGLTSHENNAFKGYVGYRSGATMIGAGYTYVDPLFYSMGYWARIGNWLNPTNIQGPNVQISHDFSPSFGVSAGYDMYEAARDRGNSGGLSREDCINRARLGVRWDVSKNFRANLDWEGVFWTLVGDHGGDLYYNSSRGHPTEKYVTLRTGYQLTSDATLNVAYQIANFNGRGALDAAGVRRYNANIFTTQVGLKF
jgi:hypothetical protein